LGLKAFAKPDGGWKPVTEELIKEALEIVLDINYHPILVMCA
jgi:tyrosine-protein phosphatase SIW14